MKQEKVGINDFNDLANLMIQKLLCCMIIKIHDFTTICFA